MEAMDMTLQKPIVLTLSHVETQLVLESLADRPFRQSAPLIQNIQTQIQKQLASFPERSATDGMVQPTNMV